MKFKKIKSGHYRAEAEGYEVIKDITGYVIIEDREGDGVLCGCDDDGWAACYPNGDQRWWDTKREAVEDCERHLKWS